MSYCCFEKARLLLSHPGQLFLIQPLPEGTDQTNRQGHLPNFKTHSSHCFCSFPLTFSNIYVTFAVNWIFPEPKPRH